MQTQNRLIPAEIESSVNATPEVLENLVLLRTAALRKLSARLLRVQEEERRHLARELHDSTGQTLTALKIELVGLEECLKARHFVPDCLTQALSLADQALREIRTMSYLLYPPLLEEMGLSSAARWYVEGFAQRSNIQVKQHLAPIGRLSGSVEIALFRVLQESLTNIYRYSNSQTADIRLECAQGRVILEVQDYGKGIPPPLLDQFKRQGGGTGVGLVGMRERIEELGGRFEIISDGCGTVIRATVPAASESPPAGRDSEPVDAFSAQENCTGVSPIFPCGRR